MTCGEVLQLLTFIVMFTGLILQIIDMNNKK